MDLHDLWMSARSARAAGGCCGFTLGEAGARTFMAW